MDSYIKKLESKPFSGEDILNILDQKTKIVLYNEIKKYKSIDSLLHPYGNVVILYETKPGYGHWVCIIKHKGKNPYIEFFDSYGMKPDQQLDYVPENMKSQPYLLKLFLKSEYPIIYNSKQLQQLMDDVSSCGRHVALRLVLRDIPLKEYLKLIINQKYNPDMIVTYLTAFQ